MQIEASGGQVPPRNELTSSAPVKSEGAATGGLLSSDLQTQRSTSLLDLYAGGHMGATDGAAHGLAAAMDAAGAAGREAAEATKAVDAKGRPMDDWNVVHNPNSTTKMHIELSHTLEHDSVVCCVRFSNDGRYIATGCNKTAVLYDAVTGNRIAMFSNEGVLETQVALDNLTCGGLSLFLSLSLSLAFPPFLSLSPTPSLSLLLETQVALDNLTSGDVFLFAFFLLSLLPFLSPLDASRPRQNCALDNCNCACHSLSVSRCLALFLFSVLFLLLLRSP